MHRIKEPANGAVKIAVVGKYVALVDSYKSVQEALIHGGIANDVKVQIDWLSSEDFENGQSAEKLADYHGLLIPGGFGVRGVEGMLSAIRWARENGLPFFGICLGLQTAVIEFSRNGVRHQRRALHRVGPRHLGPRDLPDELAARGHGHGRHAAAGGDRRRASRPGSRAAEVYGSQEISERHRHRYEVNNAYRDQLAEQGMQVSGVSPDGNLVEMMELAGPPLVRGDAGPPGAEVAPGPPAPALRLLRRRGAAPPRGGGHAHVPRGPRDAGGGAVSDAATRAGSATSVAELFRLDAPFFLIAGPCVLEDERLNLGVGEALARLSDDLGLPDRLQGVVRQGEPLLAGVAARAGAGPGTGAAGAGQAGHRAPAAHRRARGGAVRRGGGGGGRAPDSRLPLPADRPAAGGGRHRAAGERQEGAVDGAARDARARSPSCAPAGAAGVAVTERGTFFGYGNLVVDMRSFPQMREACEAPTVFDGTHSVQRPGEGGGISGGEPRFIPALVRSAVAAGADALFLETHPEPARAPSDSTNMLPLGRLRPLLEEVLAIRAAIAPRAETAGG